MSAPGSNTGGSIGDRRSEWKEVGREEGDSQLQGLVSSPDSEDPSFGGDQG